MQFEQLEAIADWFDSYVATFQADTLEQQRNYNLKIEHTWRVRENMDWMTAALALPQSERNLAAALALCHDVGRFPQFRDYGTFNDGVSANHAALAVQTLKAEEVLDTLDVEERQLLLQAVALHNAFTLPAGLDSVLLRFSQMIRDADKLDIWRVLIEYLALPENERPSAVRWGLPETGRCSDGALAEVIAGRLLHRDLVLTADDFTLLLLSWVFDLNLPCSFHLLAERGYLETLIEQLPDQERCRQVAAVIRGFVQSRGYSRSALVQDECGSSTAHR
jgi:hypothetical protein